MPAGEPVDSRALAEVLIRNHGPAASHYAEVLIRETFDVRRSQTHAILQDILQAIDELAA